MQVILHSSPPCAIQHFTAIIGALVNVQQDTRATRHLCHQISCKTFQPLWLQDPATRINHFQRLPLWRQNQPPTWYGSTPLYLDPVSPIRIDHHFVLFILVFCVNKVTQKLDFCVSTSLSSYRVPLFQGFLNGVLHFVVKNWTKY